MTQESPNINIRALHARIYPSIEEFNKPNLQNLEPLREFSYEHSVNLEDLLKLSDVMVEHFLGSNGEKHVYREK
ncbi:hypothetical protein ACFX11_034658 [Malus domestica]